MALPFHKPTVVIADDHNGILTVASMLLGGEFEILATVGDGMKAIEAVAESEAGRLSTRHWYARY